MKINLEIELGLKDTIKDIKQWWLERKCKKLGHIWRKYEQKGFLYPMWFDYAYDYGKITHECERCGEYKREEKKKTTGEKLKFRKYSELGVQK